MSLLSLLEGVDGQADYGIKGSDCLFDVCRRARHVSAHEAGLPGL